MEADFLDGWRFQPAVRRAGPRHFHRYSTIVTSGTRRRLSRCTPRAGKSPPGTAAQGLGFVALTPLARMQRSANLIGQTRGYLAWTFGCDGVLKGDAACSIDCSPQRRQPGGPGADQGTRHPRPPPTDADLAGVGPDRAWKCTPPPNDLSRGPFRLPRGYSCQRPVTAKREGAGGYEDNKRAVTSASASGRTSKISGEAWNHAPKSRRNHCRDQGDIQELL